LGQNLVKDQNNLSNRSVNNSIDTSL